MTAETRKKLGIVLDDETRPIWETAKRAALEVPAAEAAEARIRRIERLEFIAMAVAEADPDDRIGEIKVDDNGLVAYLRDYARAALDVR